MHHQHGDVPYQGAIVIFNNADNIQVPAIVTNGFGPDEQDTYKADLHPFGIVAPDAEQVPYSYDRKPYTWSWPHNPN